MEIDLLNLRKSINKAYLKVKPNRTQIETFKMNIVNLFRQIEGAWEQNVSRIARSARDPFWGA